MYSQAKVQILIFFCHRKPVTAWKKLSLRLRFTALSRGIALFIVCWDTCWFCSKADFDFGNWSSSSLTPALHTRGLKESWDNHNPFFQWVWSLSTTSNTVWITKGLPVFRGKLDGKLLLREKESGLKEHRFNALWSSAWSNSHVCMAKGKAAIKIHWGKCEAKHLPSPLCFGVLCRNSWRCWTWKMYFTFWFWGGI